MSNIELAGYTVIRKRLVDVNEDLRQQTELYPATNEVLKWTIEKVNHCIDMLDIVYGATKEGDSDE